MPFYEWLSGILRSTKMVKHYVTLLHCPARHVWVPEDIRLGQATKPWSTNTGGSNTAQVCWIPEKKHVQTASTSICRCTVDFFQGANSQKVWTYYHSPHVFAFFKGLQLGVFNWANFVARYMEHGFIDRDEAKETSTAFCCETAQLIPTGAPKSSKPHISNSTCGVQDW